jgi:hypothetical protein
VRASRHVSPVPTLTPICTDRPSKSNYACAVDAGRFQYETDLVNESSLNAATPQLQGYFGLSQKF